MIEGEPHAQPTNPSNINNGGNEERKVAMQVPLQNDVDTCVADEAKAS